MSQSDKFKRFMIPGDTECPVPIVQFIESGNVGMNYTAIVSYDELHLLLKEAGLTMLPFAVDDLNKNIHDDEIVVLRVQAKHIRRITHVLQSKIRL